MGAMFALHNDQARDSGILQLLIREASGPIRDPVFLTFFPLGMPEMVQRCGPKIWFMRCLLNFPLYRVLVFL